MDRFFRGWRRKLGVVTLVLACLFMAGWVRSLTVLDLLQFAINGRQLQLCSFRGGLRWMSGYPKAGGQLLNSRDAITVKPTVTILDNDAYFMNANGWEHFYELKSPYLPIVILLTLLSAFLLLSKPRKSTPISEILG